LAAGPGSNANAQLLAGIKDDPLPTLGETPDQYYSNVIFQIGSDSQSAYDGLQTQNNIVQQLLNQRDTFSGVSLDEEAVNIIKYQKAYQASARFVTVLDTLSDEILRILGG
jgi:flagellar hook-associated protein 1 FlgK